MENLPQTLLLMDTSMPRGVVSCAVNGHIISERFMNESRRHGEKIAETINHVLSSAHKKFVDLNGIVVGTGPGSFVGVRVAMATAKGIAVARNIPVWGVCTLSALAHAQETKGFNKVVSLIDARRGEGYAQKFDLEREWHDGEDQPVALPPTELLDFFGDCDAVVGNGFGLFGESLDSSAQMFQLLGASGIGILRAFKKRCQTELPTDECHHLVPEYVRAPDAKVPKVRPDYSVASE